MPSNSAVKASQRSASCMRSPVKEEKEKGRMRMWMRMLMMDVDDGVLLTEMVVRGFHCLRVLREL